MKILTWWLVIFTVRLECLRWKSHRCLALATTGAKFSHAFWVNEKMKLHWLVPNWAKFKLIQIVPLTLYVPYRLLKDVTLWRIAFMSEAVKQMEIGSIGFNEMFFVKEPNEEPELSALREASTGEVSLIFAVDSTGIWAPAVTCDDSWIFEEVFSIVVDHERWWTSELVHVFVGKGKTQDSWRIPLCSLFWIRYLNDKCYADAGMPSTQREST